MTRERTVALRVLLLAIASNAWSAEVALEAPRSVSRFDPAEFVLRVEKSPFVNPFTEAELVGNFRPSGGIAIRVLGFADSNAGTLFRLRFSPHLAGVSYTYKLRFRGKRLDREFSGKLSLRRVSDRAGPVIGIPETRSILSTWVRARPSTTSAIPLTIC